ncbi:MAG TPA: Mur ligase family protein [Micavibrio sp.]|nr:Mur ligase family protein [Micavibrio sp.]
MSAAPHYFVCGIGGSGMLPLAIILQGLGYTVSGSDRSRDQGRTPEKFAWIEEQGITLHPQDGSGIAKDISCVVISKAVEDTVPDIAAAKALGVPVRMRANVLIGLFNKAGTRIAVSGTSGKTTTTGMIGFLLKEAGMDPSVMNGGIFRNYIKDNPYSTAFVGGGDAFVTEVDESDGIDVVTAYEPDIAVIHNITLDHQPMDELRRMFSGFLAKTKTAVVNADDAGVMELAGDFGRRTITYGAKGDIAASDYVSHPDGIEAMISAGAEKVRLKLRLPGRHNISNALAAMAVARAVGIPLAKAADILSRFEGIRRRMEVLGTKNGITVMDDFAHNPDKIAATLSTLREFPGRLHVFFQPHGYGFLKVVGAELGQAFADYLGPEDTLYMVEPFYAGGTVDRSIGAAQIVADIVKRGRQARLMDGRETAKTTILAACQPGDRIVVMGARDDSLSAFACDIFATIG